MNFINRHIFILGRLFAVIFFLASSGFTVVLYHCTMDDMSICAPSDNCMAGNSEAADHQQPSEISLTSAGIPCHTVSVAGGLHTDPSIVEKESSAKHIKIEFVLAPTSDSGLTSIVDQPIQLLSTNTSNVSPPSVEKYVLNATFLI